MPMLKCREDLKERRELLAVLEPQVKAHKEVVELLKLEDDGERTIGQKRNLLVADARGDWVCHCDDDDKVPDNYVVLILKALGGGRDCVGFKMKRFSNGRPIGEGVNSLRYERYHQWGMPNGMTFYERTPNHLNPMRREIAGQVKFPDLNWREDRDFAEAVRPLLKTETFVDEYLYHYLYRTPYARRHERANKAA